MLLRLLAGVDLDEAIGPAAGAVHLERQRPGELGPVDGLDDIAEPDGGARLVGLQRTDEVEADIVEGGFQRWPLGFRLLHPVLAEDAMAGRQRGTDAVLAMGLRDGDEGDRVTPPRSLGGGANARAHRLEMGGDVGDDGGRRLRGHLSRGTVTGAMAAGSFTLAELANRLNLACPAARAGDLPALIFLTDERRTPDPRAAVASLPRGSAVIVRHYGDPDRVELAAALGEICRGQGLSFLIAADPALAVRLGADGVHMPEWLVRRGGVAWSMRSNWLVTAAAHDRRGLIAAVAAGAHAALLSPVFPTLSHQGAPALGVVRFTALARTSPLPVYALGGVGATTARRLASSGAVGLAAIGALAARPGTEA